MTKEEIRKAQEKVIYQKIKNKKQEDKLSSSNKKIQYRNNKKAITEEIKNKTLEQLSLKESVNPNLRPTNFKEDQPIEGKVSVKELENLEEALAKEKIPQFVRESQYTQELSREPVQVLYEQAKELTLRAEEKGYLNPAEQRQIEYITGAIEEKVESGEYSFTEETARKASLTLQLAAQSKSLYKGGSIHPKSWYQSG